MFAHFSFACLVSTMRHVAAHPTHTNDMMARDTTRILVHATLDEAHTFLALKIDCFFSTVFLIGPYIIIQYTGKTLHIFKDRTALGSKWCYVYPHICVQRILWWQLQRAILLCCRQKCDFIHILAFCRRPCFTHVLCLYARFPTKNKRMFRSTNAQSNYLRFGEKSFSCVFPRWSIAQHGVYSNTQAGWAYFR